MMLINARTYFQDVFVIDNGQSVYVYIGKGASDSEKKNAMSYAHVSTHIFNKD